ncbi:hypothetical protein COO91_03475 [Nostoc flagelliforme CCNUN1]|uniref:Uncharacterized protein n=1 Tax=Nostoc flagelliforme CCNUN1 TaxID=2038116 RepID=A0A2K8SQA8_9NOSO|nr:hypothetical protein [Nostoc flagelliforme]AUB37530.1 hypothetical protein COO91_03475 [Nostoc flagelliforme CCNUN1]
MAPLTGYYIADKASLKALTPSQRTNGYSRATSIGTDSEWYMFLAASTANADDDAVLMPNDNPPTGRWHKYGSNRGGGIPGRIICNSQCGIAAGGSGKAFQFYSAQTVGLVIVPGFDINIQTNNDAIRVYRWSQEPNTPRFGQEATPIIQLPKTGGKFTVNITSTYRWISVYARNPSQNNNLDGTCFTVTGNVISLLGYS